MGRIDRAMEESSDSPLDVEKRILELRQLFLTSDDDERLLTELARRVNHPEPTTVLFSMERHADEESFGLLLNYEPRSGSGFDVPEDKSCNNAPNVGVERHRVPAVEFRNPVGPRPKVI